MKKRFLSVLAVLFILGGIGMAGKICLEYKKGRDRYADMEDRYTAAGSGAEPAAGGSDGGEKGEEEYIPADAPPRVCVDWDGLRSENEEVIAWLQLPAIDRSYPVLQGEDNEYYLHRAPSGEYLYAGSIFMDYYNRADFSNLNTVLYGHNMRDGSMFGELKRYKDPETFSVCPYFWIYTPKTDLLYRIFSVHTASESGRAYTVRFADYDGYTAWLDEMREASAIDTGAAASPGDTVVTLSTCSDASATRQTVQGYLVTKAVVISRGKSSCERTVSSRSLSRVLLPQVSMLQGCP